MNRVVTTVALLYREAEEEAAQLRRRIQERRAGMRRRMERRRAMIACLSSFEMRVLTLLPTDSAPGERQAGSGTSLVSTYLSPPCLENKLLARCSSLLSTSASSSFSCPSLHATSLSSNVTSTLLSISPSCITSPLLDTENRLLRRDLVPLHPSSSASTAQMLVSSLDTSSGALLRRFSPLSASSLRYPDLGSGGKEVPVGDEGDVVDGDGGEELSEEMRSSCKEKSMHSEGEEDDEAVAEIPVLKIELANQKHEATAAINLEEFPQIEREKDDAEEDLNDKKYLLLNAVCSSLVNAYTAPGQKDWDEDGSVWTHIKTLAKEISDSDPQFLLKVAVYTRQELNIRITANFLLALAAHQSSTKPHVRRYYCAAVQLPSDWLEVARIYSTCFTRCLPTCLKKAMVDKFKQFNEYQLAKYNTRKHRGKHNRKVPKAKTPSRGQIERWATLVRSDEKTLRNYMKVDTPSKVVDKKQKEFSLKKLIRRLHIKEPAQHVMALLGRKYPADAKAFIHSGLSGEWDRERAGQRMKLKQPETWERMLSQHGNKAATWEKLIDNQALPFMAMLRNLRNMITQGISETHHQRILSRLTNKRAVIQSRQLPLRFLAAYKVIMELKGLALAAQNALPQSMKILKGILLKIPKSKRFRSFDWETAQRKRLRVALGVPFVYSMYKKKKAVLQKANQRLYSIDLLDRYCKGLESAVQTSCRYNIPPLPGRTAILVCTNPGCDNPKGKYDFCIPPEPEQEGEKDEDMIEDEDEENGEEKKDETNKPTPTIQEVAVLLSLMIRSSAEDPMLCLYYWKQFTEVKLKSDVLLDNVRSVMRQIKEQDYYSLEQVLSDLFSKKNKWDNIIVVAHDGMDPALEWSINKYKSDVNDKALLVTVFLGASHPELSTNRNSVELNGFSEHILRFVAERGSSRLMDHVEHMDKLHKIPPPEGGKDPQTTTTVVPIPASPILRWRGVRVFISSTFRDMHAERDILVRSVFPELRRRAAPHCLYLQEVELRWGVTEEESGRAVELCLSEVCRSQMMVVILGERYGLVPPRPTLPDLPQYSWLTSAPAQLSITELEIRQFQALYPDSTHQRMFCYFRDPTLTESIPVAWRSHFAPESKQAQSKMDDLKTRILASGAKVTENYLCEWEGVVGGNPYLKGLEEFGKAVLEDLWTAVLKQYVGEGDEARAASDISEQYVHQGALQRQFYGRAKLLAGAVEKVRAIQAKGGVLLVDGAHGEGKTVFMAALANALRSNDNSKPACDVISYSTGASQSARCVENLLRCLVQWLRARKNNEEESPLPTSYKDLMTEFHDDMKKVQLLALLVDGVDLVQDSWGQLNSDWMPHQVPKGVCLVVSVTSGSALFQALSKKKGTILFPLGQLSMPDRREIVENGLDVFGKKLSDSAFNNQLQMLMMKKGAVTPLYLHLACEDLRNFATFDKMNESLQGLPQSLGQLVTHSLDRLCSQYKVVVGLRQALGALTVSCTGLRESDLYAILNTLIDLTSKGEAVTLVEVLHQARKPRGRVPMATFTHLVRSLQSLIGPTHCHGTDRLLAVTNPDVRRAFEEFFLPAEVDRVRAHLLLAAHLWAIADRQGTDTFLHCEGHPIMHLPSHLMKSDQWDALASLLSSYYFLYANVRHRLLHPLLLTYSSYNEKNKSVVSGDGHGSNLEECCSFLRRHAALLTSWPTLFVQQALNEPSHTAPHSWARALMGKGGGRRVVQLLNSAGNIPGQNCDLLSTFSSEPTCVGMSPDAGMMVVGTAHGLLHLIHTQTGQEVKRLASSCDGVSSCLFLTEGVVATTSFDGKIEIWNIDSGCRNVCIEGHANVITGSDVKADGKYFATVSLDYQLKVWSASKGHLEKAITSSSPLNCVTFNPDGDLLAAGCWNGNVNLWSWRGTKAWTYLSGHQRSVRSLSFSPSSSTLCSGSLSGEVKVWSVASSTCVGSYQAHSGSTAALAFLNEGRMLLSAGSDHTLHLWSGGLGRSLAVFEEVTCAEESPQKKVKACISEPAALCVAVDRDCAAVGYHGNGLKLFSLESGERTWASEDLRVSMLCLLWLTTPADAKQAAAALLVSGGGDNRLRVWKRPGEKGNLVPVGGFGVQQGSILALAQNSSHLASASDDFTIALWSVEDLTLEPWVCPTVVSVLRGHSGGVTCLAFSPDGAELLSGGKDQALLVWDVSSSVLALSRSFLHAHRDWITDCAWTSHCVVSCSNDGRLHVWHMESGECIARISWKSPLSSVCIQGQYLVAGCGEGGLHVWKWRSEEEVMEVSHISAHHQRIHHCSILPNRDETKEDIPEEMVVVTASDDGSVQLWKPFQVEHFCTFQGHSGAIHGVVSKKGLTEFLTVSEDLSLRSWVWAKESPRAPSSVVTAVCYSQTDDLLLAAYESGLMEIWRHNTVVAHKQASSSPISAVCSMPDGQFAAACRKPAVHVWKLVWNPQRRDASLVKISTYKVKEPIIYLHYCTALIGASDQGKIHDVTTNEGSREIENWDSSVRILGTRPNDGKSMWWLGESDGCVSLGFLFSMGPQTAFCSSFSSDSLEPDLPEEQRSLITAATVDGELVVCGDVKGNLWFNLPPAVSSWTSRMPAHHDRISVLRLTRSEIISASYDRTVKLWDRDSKKQVGMFVCEGPVVVLEVNPHRPNELVCGDAVGKLYFLCLRQ